MDSNEILGIIITIFLVFVIMSALYPMIENSASNLKTTFETSNNTYVKQYLPSLTDYAPFLFALAVIIGIILLTIKYLKTG
ncbi:MAG: hypothetical protein DRO40_06710 [Thermoprotei archaeon]|nr:MAG: hypothetical protein DRO40_06710 [Thermoprotei archaeon]